MATTRPNDRYGDVLTPDFQRDSATPRPWTVWDAIKAFSPRNMVFALILGVLAAAGGAAVALQQTPVYSSQTKLIIDQPKALAAAQDDGPIRKLAVLKVKYANLAESPAVTGPASESLGMTDRQVASAITATALPFDLLLTVTAESSTSARAERIANAVGASIINYVNQEQTQLNVPPDDRYNFSTIETAATATRIQPTNTRALQAAIGLGVISALLAYVILQLIAPRPR
jgi:capsular polysaccharide biosynthesis protein